MTKQKKLLLKQLLKQYKQSLSESVIPKKGDTISIDMNVVNQHASGFGGPQWLSIIKKMLKNSGNNTLLVHSVNGNYVDVSGWSGDSILGTAQLPISAIKTIVKQSKRRIKESNDRPLWKIASQISHDWKNVNYAAKPYLQAMADLDSINDKYILDPGSSIVAYFLSNASSWKGEKAKEIKAQLNRMLKNYYKSKH